MRLNPFDTSKIRVRSSGGGGLPGGKAGGIGCGTLVIALIGAVVFGVDPMQTIGVVEGVQQGASIEQRGGDLSEQEVCTSGEYAREACNALTSLNETWAPEFQRAGIRFQDPVLDLYRNAETRNRG